MHVYRLARVRVRQALADQQWMVCDYELFSGPLTDAARDWIASQLWSQLSAQFAALGLDAPRVLRYLQRCAAREAVARGTWAVNSPPLVEHAWLTSIAPRRVRYAA